MSPPHFTRTRDNYLISTDPTLLSPTSIAAAFAHPSMYWCTPLPLPKLQLLLSSSLCLGLYRSTAAHSQPIGLGTGPKPEQIGLARLVTDNVTFAYLTDVYVVEEEQGKGLGTWLTRCVGEVLEGMEGLRRAMLVTGEGGKEGFYERELGMERLVQGRKGLVVMNRLGKGAAEMLKD
ncbi:MAG: hypothetical protein FRX48_03078 [Lasallia pustulata]|uniref:N-acetyltransferase domain-containing protein n=1 Tax=Lasallia pustulata TaxID=136370 RepID=A0A5M8PUT7_9LECA|nr:MAG: hypothetical protein FRX48_03078 [Lasallia pustulata]